MLQGNFTNLSTYSILDQRSVIQLKGAYCRDFLQGIVTNDMQVASPDQLIYALILNPQGKVLYDLFILEVQEGYLLDVPSIYCADIVKKLNMYKLRLDVSINEGHDLCVLITKNQCANFFKDPRYDSFFYRGFAHKKTCNHSSDSLLLSYHQSRVQSKVPECGIDFEAQQYFALELNMSNCRAINTSKGCYVGQEVTARTIHRLNIRRCIYSLDFGDIDIEHQIARGTEIYFDDIIVGHAMQPFGASCLAMLNKDIASTIIEKGLKVCLNNIYASIN